MGQCILSNIERVEATPFSYPTVRHRRRHAFLGKDGALRLAPARLGLQLPFLGSIGVLIRPISTRAARCHAKGDALEKHKRRE